MKYPALQKKSLDIVLTHTGFLLKLGWDNKQWVKCISKHYPPIRHPQWTKGSWNGWSPSFGVFLLPKGGWHQNWDVLHRNNPPQLWAVPSMGRHPVTHPVTHTKSPSSGYTGTMTLGRFTLLLEGSTTAYLLPVFGNNMISRLRSFQPTQMHECAGWMYTVSLIGCLETAPPGLAISWKVSPRTTDKYALLTFIQKRFCTWKKNFSPLLNCSNIILFPVKLTIHWFAMHGEKCTTKSANSFIHIINCRML